VTPRSPAAPGPRPDGAALERALHAFEQALAEAGLDLLARFSVAALTARLAPLSDADLGLSLFGGADALGVVIGNSRALWTRFETALAAPTGAALAEHAHPLDTYVTAVVRRALETSGLGAEGARVRYAHELEPAPIPIQRIADAAGLATLGPVHLNVHPELGPWLALRAVVSVAAAPSALAGLLASAAPPTRAPCEGCAAPCRDALERALTGAPPSQTSQIPELGAGEPLLALSAESARLVAVRDECPVGRHHRYGLPQLCYHYDKCTAALPRGLPAALGDGDRRPVA
jgi:methylmalonic aciduria homocystinuria type C protein